jgi:transcriptional regulator with XRE-family HTH domain
MAVNKTKWQPPKRVEEQDVAVIGEIGKKLEKLRENQGLSIHAYAKDLGISRNSYTQMEQGEIYFSLRNLLLILSYHGIDLKKFIGTDIKDL